MKIQDLDEAVGRIVKGVNTTADVGTDEIKRQAAKFGNTVDKDGNPPTLSKKVKGSTTNVLFNLGLTEGIKLKLERDDEIDVLHIWDTTEKHRVEVRGKKNYESGGYDANDKLHQVLDRVGKAANISELMNGETVSINPKHPQGTRAIRTAKDVLHTENLYIDKMEKALLEGGNSPEDIKYFKKVKETPEPKMSADFIRQQTLSDAEKRKLEGELDRLGMQLFWKSYGEDLLRLLGLALGGVKGRRIANYIIKIKNRLKESFDTEVEWILGHDNDKEKVYATKVDGAYLELTYKEFSNGDIYIAFSRGGQMKVTGEGKQNKIFGSVVNHIKDFVEKTQPKRVIFSAFKPRTGAFGTQDNTRTSLYRRMVQRFANQNGYDYDVEDTGNEDTFILTKQNQSIQTTEALDQPYSIRWSVKNDNEWYGHAKEDDFYNQIGIEIKDGNNSGRWTIRFKVGDKMDKTGEGDQFKIFATVKAAVQEWWKWASKNAEVDQITFSAEKIVDSSRSKLYQRFAQQFARSIGYEMDVVSGRATDIFYIKKPGLEENFADGKVKGKSRPGRVKRAGASCNGSVTDLRKRAKNSSGEKAKMYHWCANMKSGRKKK